MSKKKQIENSEDAFNIVKNLRHLDQEVLIGLFLNSKNEVMVKREVFRGTVCSLNAQPREIFRLALIINATKIIIAHNHPSRDFLPSNEDIKFTLQMNLASQIIGIPFLDHIIVATNKCYYSFADEGLLKLDNWSIKWPELFVESSLNKLNCELQGDQDLNLKSNSMHQFLYIR